MADYEFRYRKRPALVTRVLGAVGVGALVTSLEDQELDAPDPKVVTWTERSAALRALAAELVDAGRYDREAAGALARAAGRHPKELKRAAAAVRQGGWAAEDEVSYRVDRLLVAAVTGQVPERLDRTQLDWFAQVRTLIALPAAEGFRLLSDEEPALAAFEGDVLRVVAHRGFEEWDDDRRTEALAPAISVRLVGIIDGSPSRLLHTQAARYVLRDHAYGLVGVTPPDAYAPPVWLPGP